MTDRFKPDASLIPLMGPELLGEFIGDGNSINVATGEIFPPYRFPLHIDREGLGHYGGAIALPAVPGRWP
jgi:hypothetical protein